MKRLAMSLLLGAAFSAMAGAASSQQSFCSDSGKDLADCAALWESQRNGAKLDTLAGIRVVYFRGYVLGFSVGPGNGDIYCTKDGTSPTQIYAVVAKFLRENPEVWGHGAPDLIAVALKRAFPCRDK